MSGSTLMKTDGTSKVEARGCALALQGIGHGFGTTVALETVDLAVSPGPAGTTAAVLCFHFGGAPLVEAASPAGDAKDELEFLGRVLLEQAL